MNKSPHLSQFNSYSKQKISQRMPLQKNVKNRNNNSDDDSNMNSEKDSSLYDEENAKQTRKRQNQNRARKESSSSSQSQSSEDSEDSDAQARRDRQKKMQRKKQIMQLKQQNKLVQVTKKKLGEKEQVIENLSSQIGKQKEDLNQLNQQNENLKAKTDQLDTVIQEKSNLENHFATQMLKVEQAKQAIKRKQSVINDKAEEFQQALNKKSFRQQVSHKMKNIFTYLLETIENNYFLSKQVYLISNSYGSKSEVSFSSNAYYVNLYIFSILVFIPFFVEFFLHVQIESFDSIFLHNYSSKVGQYFIITVTIFFIFQALICFKRFTDVKKKEIKEIAKSGKEINNFRIVFAEWNWKIKDYLTTQKSQFALMKYADSYFQYEMNKQNSNSDYDSDFDSHLLIKDLSILFVFVVILIGDLFVTAFIHYQGYLLKITNQILVSEIIHGAAIALIGRFSSEIMNVLMRNEAQFNSNDINYKKYSRQFFCQLFPAALSILLSYNSFLSEHQITLDFNIFSTEINFDGTKFECPEQQTSHFLLGLVIGYFAVNILWQYFISLITKLFASKSKNSVFSSRIGYSMMKAQIPLIVMNMILLALLPFTAFAIFFSVLIFYFNFYNEWLLIQKFKLPQYRGAPKSQLKLHNIQFQNLTLIFIFCCYSLYYTNIFLPISKGNSIKACSPYSDYGKSIYSVAIDEITSISFIKDIYSVIAWYPLILVLLLASLTSHFTSQGLYKFWKQEIKNKNSEISGVKTYYEQRIERLENKIKQTQQVLQNIQDTQNHNNETGDDFYKQTDSRRQSDESIVKNATQQTLNFDTDHVLSLHKIKGSNGSIRSLLQSQANIKSRTNNLKDIEEEDDAQYKQTSLVVFK